MLVWSASVLAAVTFCIGCGKSQNGTKSVNLSGAAPVASIKDSTGYTETKTDPFNSANGLESTRKLKPGAFGSYKGEKPPDTPTMEATALALDTGEAPKLSVGMLEHFSIIRTSFPFDYENDNAQLKSLYDLHKLDNVIKSDMDDMQKAVALMSYTRKFLDGGALPGPGVETGPSAFLVTKNQIGRAHV